MNKMLYIALLLASMSIQAQGNPTPNLKRVHMALSHPDATEWEILSHPDFDYHTEGVRFDQLKNQPIEWMSGHMENGLYVVHIRYMNETYSRHEFPKRRWAKDFKKLVRTKQASIKEIIAQRINNAL